MKTDIILKRTGQKVSTYRETARLLIEMGKAVSVEAHLAAKAAANADTETKADTEAETRKTKVVEPAKRKSRRANA